MPSSARAMVTSPHYLASEAGRDVLRQGGNAIEAAVAMGAVLSVTYPHFCGIGGDAVWVIADRAGRRTCLLGIGQAAGSADAVTDIPTRGPGSVLTSAAAVDSWGHALGWSADNWNGTQSLSRLLEPAIVHADEGFPLSPSQAHWRAFRRGETDGWPGFAAVFTEPVGAGGAGTRFRQPELATTLARIARHGHRDFYEGDLAARIAAGLAAAGAPLRPADLKATCTREVSPLELDYRGVTLLAPPPPTQGVTTLEIMGILERLGHDRLREGSAADYHALVEAVKRAFLHRGEVGDPDFGAEPGGHRLAEESLSKMAADIDPQAALPWPHAHRSGDTVFLAATDAEGRSASVLQSLYFDWGSGVVAGDTGILWQNRGAAFSLQDGHPNRLRPGKRPFYTLNPGMALRNGRPALLYGTQGADGQPQTLSVLLTRVLDHGLSPSEALARPRFLLGRTFSDANDTLKIEADLGEAEIAELAALGHDVAPIAARSPLAGQAGLIAIAGDGTVEGAHDPRSDGLALPA